VYVLPDARTSVNRCFVFVALFARKGRGLDQHIDNNNQPNKTMENYSVSVMVTGKGREFWLEKQSIVSNYSFLNASCKLT